jgi:hypothetical protein
MVYEYEYVSYACAKWFIAADLGYIRIVEVNTKCYPATDTWSFVKYVLLHDLIF